MYIGEDAAEHFVDTVVELEEKHRQILADRYTPLKVTPEVKRAYDAAKVCWLCEKEFIHDAVMDHDHLTGKGRKEKQGKKHANN